MRRRLIALLSVPAMWACLDVMTPASVQPSPPPPGGIALPAGRADRKSVAAALHLHGWSNHSGNTRPASIAWHTQQYATAGVELVWWTDHSDVYVNRLADLVVTPQTPALLSHNVW